jgi:hypothetical protein
VPQKKFAEFSRWICPHAASGSAAAPPSSVMSSRRLMGLSPEGHTLSLQEYRLVHHSKIGR